MKYIKLGNSGLRVSDFCLGTMTFGHGTEEREAERIVTYAFEEGVRFFDTADSYSDGESERMLGKALRGRRHEVVVATKFSNPMGEGINDSGWSRLHVMRAAEESLRRLGTDYIDLYYVHHTDDQTPTEEMLRALDDLVRQGKVRYLGVSNFESWRLAETLWQAESSRLEKPIAYQAPTAWS
ncbi:MAG TPA: aldo/keto reductase [Sediminispirochaeta sp.]|nr:aldo/keto reductase [Sediminispirochaeta sp.]